VNDSQDSLERGLGRVEARVCELSTQIQGLRQELTNLAHNVKTSVAGHSERLKHLESFRRSLLGILTALFLSGVAAVFGYILK
jgi:hypothetical protein